MALSLCIGIVMLPFACLIEAVCLAVSIAVLIPTRERGLVARACHDATQETKNAFQQAKSRMQRILVTVVLVLAALCIRLMYAIRTAEAAFNA
jgi:uncharacterized protein (UPF0333 family)